MATSSDRDQRRQQQQQQQRRRRRGTGRETGSGESTAAGDRDFYAVLGVARDADADAIQRAYRTLARKYHPDVNADPEAEERFKDVSEAYQVLSDPTSRKRYDRFGADFRRVPEGAENWAGARAGAGAGAGAGAAGGRRYTAGGPDPAGFGGVGGFGGFSGFGDGVGGGIDFDDLFGEGGYFRQRARAGPMPGADQEAEITISLADAYRGARRRITLPAPGGGSRSLDVTVPAGITAGQRLRLAGQGGSGRGGGPPGDLYLVVRVAADPRFRIDGRAVHTDLPLAPWEGALGAKVRVATVDGGDATVAVPAGTSSGRTLRLRGKGLPNPGGAPGDLLAHVMIMVPSTLNPREQELFTELARASAFDPRGQHGSREGGSP